MLADKINLRIDAQVGITAKDCIDVARRLCDLAGGFKELVGHIDFDRPEAAIPLAGALEGDVKAAVQTGIITEAEAKELLAILVDVDKYPNWPSDLSRRAARKALQLENLTGERAIKCFLEQLLRAF